MINISLLGASGSVGESCLRIIRKYPEKLKLLNCSIHSNLEKAKSIIEEFNPDELVVTLGGVDKTVLGKKFGSTKIRYGFPELNEIVSGKEVDIVITALVGSVGIHPTMSAIRANKKIGIANKETLVTFGPIIRKLLGTSKSYLIPVDSEHNALFQLLENRDLNTVKCITLTASGGSFRDYPKERLHSVSVEEALRHPTWKMGPKITIDSASLVNKSLEVIEAHFLFNMPYDNIEVVIHPESIVHGIVESNDGALFLYASHPDMIFPIAHSIFYPESIPSTLIERKPSSFKNLTFRDVDSDRYPALSLAYSCGRIGGTAPCIFNASNEIAVEAFLKNQIGFMRIPEIISETLNKIPESHPDSLEEYLEIDSLARKVAYSIIESI